MDSDDLFELELTAMAHGGSALGRHAKQTVFVPYTIPGERILARITQDKGRIAFAEGVKLLDASADRVFPQCPHFGPGRCGRCQWQHIDYPAQLLLKQDVLADQLSRIGEFDDATIESAVQAVIPSPEQWGYNFHMTLEALTSPPAHGERQTGSHLLGFPGADGRVFPISECHILHPALLELYHRLDMELAGVRRLKLQLGSDGAPMLIVWMEDDSPPELETDLPMSVNMMLSDHVPVNLIGERHSRCQVGERVFRVTAGSTFRANLAQLELLVRLVVEALDPAGHAVLDLYAGVGLFSAFLAAHARQVTLVESYPPAAADAAENLRGWSQVEVLEDTVESALARLKTGAYGRAVIDPPPDGLSLTALDRLVGLQLPRLVYVSSDPAVLARDGKRLAQHGYRLIRAQPVDLAPQTYYIDTVAAFAL